MFLKTLEKLMNEKGINKNQLAKESNIPYTTIDGWFKKGYDGIRYSTLKILADYFDVSLELLMNGEDNQKNASCDVKCSPKEKRILEAYRRKTEMQAAVDAILLNDNYNEEYSSDFIIGA